MDVEQIKEWLAAGEVDAIEEAWMAAAEGDAPVAPEQAGAVLTALVEAEQDDLADTLGWAMLEDRKDRMGPEQRLALAKGLSLAVPLSAELRQQALAVYRELHGTHRHFEALVKASELMNAPTPRRAYATLDLCLHVQDGMYLAGRFGHQVLQVRRFDETLGEYDLEDLAGSATSTDPRKLADEFERIDETDFRVLSRRDPERLKALFQSDPAAVLMGVCQSREGRIDSVELKELLVPRYLEAGQWSKWWSKARTAAKRCPKLTVEGRNPIFLVYHPKGLTLEDELAGDLDAAKTPQDRLELARRYAREARQRKLTLDADFGTLLTDALADDARRFQDARPTDALVASLGLAEAARLGLPQPETPAPPAAEILASAADPVAVVAGLEDASLWPAAMDALAALDGAPEHLLALLPELPYQQLDKLAGLIRQAGRAEELSEAAAKAAADPLNALDLCLWLWLGPAEPVPSAPERLELFSRLLKAMHDLDIDLQIAAGLDRKEIQRRIRTVLGARDLAGYREVIAGIDEAMASILKKRIERCDGLAESLRDDMLGILRENFYGLFAKARALPWEDPNVLYTTEAALHRYEAELKELVEVTIPANSRAIGEAADHGDLSENSEWKYAVEERNKLQQRQAQMQEELAKARILHPEEVQTNAVGIGSRVTLRRADNGSRIELSILGPWDTDLARHRYAYLTALARALLGKAPGETAALKLEGDEAEYVIEALGVAEF